MQLPKFNLKPSLEDVGSMTTCNGSKRITTGCSRFAQEGSGMNTYLHTVLLLVSGVTEGLLRYAVPSGPRSTKQSRYAAITVFFIVLTRSTLLTPLDAYCLFITPFVCTAAKGAAPETSSL